MNIAEALTKLDTENNEHWTADGLPLVNQIRELCKRTSIDRQSITVVAPDFTRESARVAQADKGPEVDPNYDGGTVADQVREAREAESEGGGDENKAADAAPEPPTVAAEKQAEDELSVAAETGETGLPLIVDGMTNEEKAEVYDALAGLKQAEIDQALSDQKTARNRFLVFTREHDKLLALREHHAPSPTETEAIREYINSQKTIREQRIARRNKVLEHLSPSDLRKGSPLDESRRRKNTRGAKRIVRRPMTSAG